MELLLEGIESNGLPCTLALVVPGLAVVLAGQRRAAWAATGFVVAAAIGAWWVNIGWVEPAAGGFGTALAIVVGVGAVWWLGQATPRSDRPWTSSAGVFGGAAVVGVVAALLWRPCVGRHLGALFERSQSETWALGGPYLAFVAGTCIVLVGLAALPAAVPNVQRLRDHQVTAIVGVGLGAVIAVTMAAGVYGDVVAELYLLST